MSNDAIPGCIVHKDSRNIQTRLDYMLLFRNETKAKIIRIMETWTDQKRAEWFKLQKDNKESHAEEPPEEALWVTMAYEEFSIYAYGTTNHDTIKKNVDELVTHEYMQRRPHPTPGLAPQYLLDTKILQEVLNDQDIPSLFEDIGKIRPPRKNHTPPEKYPQGRGINTPRAGGNLPPGTGDFSYPSNNTTKNYRESTKNKDTIVATSVEDRNALAPITHLQKWKEESGKHPAVKPYDILASNPIIHTHNPYHGLDPYPFGYRSDLPDADPINQEAWEKALQAVKPPIDTASHIATSGYEKGQDGSFTGNRDDPLAHRNAVHSNSHAAFPGSGGEEIDDDTPTVKVAAVKIGGTNNGYSHNDTSHDYSNMLGYQHGKAHTNQGHSGLSTQELEGIASVQTPGTDAPLPAKPQLSSASISAQATVPRGQPVRPERVISGTPGEPGIIPKRPRDKKPVTMPEPKSDTKEIQGRIDEHRGYKLEEKGQIIQERIAVKTWCNLHEIGDYDQTMRYLTTIDPYWRKDDNKYRIGGVTLLKETPKALAALKRPESNIGVNGLDLSIYGPQAWLNREAM
jgi:hypothetical protein